MVQDNKKAGVSSSTVAKAGLWYTVCTFLFRAMGFITTPIFTRMLTSVELGSFTNISSWASLMLVITSFDLQTSIIRSKLDHEEDMDSYIWSILSLSTIFTIFVYIVTCVFSDFFQNFFQMDMKFIHIMFAYLILTPAYNMYLTKQRAFYKYKSFVAYTGILLLSSMALSVILVLTMSDKLMGRTLGNYIPQIIISLSFYIIIVCKGKKIKLKYWQYAATMCIPLVPHELALYLLGAAGKILITRFCGESYTAIYSVAYSAYHIVSILFSSMNKAWAPWLLDNLHAGKQGEIKKISKIYIALFLALVCGVLLLGPELIWILGGEKYMASVKCLPPLIIGCVFQFVYTMYVNIEFYKKKTIGVAGATIIATVVNISLNVIFIPRMIDQGYIVAAYSTMLGYILLFILHYFLVKHLGMEKTYDTKYVVCSLLASLVMMVIIMILYQITILRYVIILVYGVVMLMALYRYWNEIKGFVIDRRKK